MAEPERRVRVLVSGHVQGVFFRATTRDRASQVGATGWVRNLPDGRLEAEVQGTARSVEDMLDFLRDGPAQAVVTDVRVEELDVRQGERGFGHR